MKLRFCSSERARKKGEQQMNYYARALELREETVAHRRYFHTNAELGLKMPKAQAYLLEKLTEYGLEPRRCGQGIIATVGKGGKCILLRADMDALPMKEESGLDFACPTGTEAHTCGHDFHAAMLLTAAKILKENEDKLEGTVKFMFQPGEETQEGAANMLENGLMENPTPDAAFAYHITSGRMPVGIYMYNSTGTMMFSADGFKIHIKGKGSHGAYPHSGIDPINIGVHVYLALEALIAREADPSKSCVMTVGSFNAGSAPNIIPDTAVLQGTIRTNDKAARELLVRRMKEVSIKTADAYGGIAAIEMIGECPPLVCDPKLTEEFVGYIKEMNIPGTMPYPGISTSASEDFALIADKIPSSFMFLSAGYLDERGDFPAHNPKVHFNEDVCPVGAGSLAYCAARWLENNK